LTIRERNARFKQEEDLQLMEKIERMMTQLERKLKQPFWTRIGKLDRSIMSLVMQMAPNYRDAFQIFITISKGLVLRGQVYKRADKEVVTLVEYRKFMKIGHNDGRNYEIKSKDDDKMN